MRNATLVDATDDSGDAAGLIVQTSSGAVAGLRLRAGGDPADPEYENRNFFGSKEETEFESQTESRDDDEGPDSAEAGSIRKKKNSLKKHYKRQRKIRKKILKAATQLDPQCMLTRDATAQYIRTWRGIPYGEPTGGRQRFRAPQPRKPWSGVCECFRYGDPALQPTWGLGENTIGSEDCLNLDIVRPDSEEQLPVVVYMHGGSFFMGASHTDLLRGHTLALDMNVVYVGLNFRLGALGYLDLRSLGADCVATPALHDQILALRWVQKNIAAFGGDPNRVTIMGESAGGAAVLTLMCVPSAAGLFHRAIAQSPAVGAVHSAQQSRYWAGRLWEKLGLEAQEDATEGEDGTRTAQLSDSQPLQAMRSVSGPEIIRAADAIMWRAGAVFDLNLCFGTTVDRVLLHQHPIEVFAAGQQLKVPLLVGTNVDEVAIAKGLYLRSTARSQAVRRILASFDPDHTEEVMQAYRQAEARRDYAAFIGDAVFWAPTVLVASSHAQAAPTWMYRFDYTPALLKFLGFGAMHTMELTPIFGDYKASKIFLAQFGGRDVLEAVGIEMRAFWREFIYHGSPGEIWPQYKTATDKNPGRATMVFDEQSHVLYDPKASVRRVWERFDLTQWAENRSGELSVQSESGDGIDPAIWRTPSTGLDGVAGAEGKIGKSAQE